MSIFNAINIAALPLACVIAIDFVNFASVAFEAIKL